MAKTPRSRSNFIFGLLAGLAGSVSLAVLWHLFGFDSPPSQAGDEYQFTEYFTSSIGWPFLACYILVSLFLGWTTQCSRPVAIGMILPLPIALVVELSRDPTSHNLFPFEIIIFWVPAFIVAFSGAYFGQLIRARST